MCVQQKYIMAKLKLITDLSKIRGLLVIARNSSFSYKGKNVSLKTVARELGVPADDARLVRGINWLRTNQRESGKWFTRSPVNECQNLISNVGSAYAVLALQACGDLPGWPFDKAKPKSR